ncbi:RNA 2',3'-cyclic phosphodiesterase [Alteribacter aurantiacus]|uniref:RNA 2',3'-cyclic phosphodiesterase n=1 Tax=Alteribacter aurantiacus TaxID=254410 RepID=UPI0004162CA6|nr:RNA 2',3'-cyclic phosphodiesterase [Alteribacter aurantiacus]
MKEDHYFIGLPVPDKVVEPLVEAQQHFDVESRFKSVTQPEDFHITLLFFGGWENEKREQLWEVLKEKLKEEESVALTLREISSFGRPAEPRVLWAGLAYSKPLMALQKKMKDIAKKHDFPIEERPFTPHITLAKTYTGEKPLRLQNLTTDLPQIGWDGQEVVLYKIHPQAKPKYERVDSITLQ